MFRGFAMLIMAMLVSGTARSETVREQRIVMVDGQREVWRLVWQGPARPFCPVEDADVSLTCPCSGYAYGEAGKLALVRQRDGREVERKDLGYLFDEDDSSPRPPPKGEGWLQRWPTRPSDIERSSDPRLPDQVRRRPVVRLMRPADYDHDGQATEFLIQVGILPCGKRQYAAVGVSRSNPLLHALASTAHPDRALIMPPQAWAALLKSRQPTPVVTWECGDHGSDERSTLSVSAGPRGITAVERRYGCDSAAGRLVGTTLW
jgi:hypothetical protein